MKYLFFIIVSLSIFTNTNAQLVSMDAEQTTWNSVFNDTVTIKHNWKGGVGIGMDVINFVNMESTNFAPFVEANISRSTNDGDLSFRLRYMPIQNQLWTGVHGHFIIDNELFNKGIIMAVTGGIDFIWRPNVIDISDDHYCPQMSYTTSKDVAYQGGLLFRVPLAKNLEFSLKGEGRYYEWNQNSFDVGAETGLIYRF